MRAAGQGQLSNVHFGELFLSDVRFKVANTSCGPQLWYIDDNNGTMVINENQ